MQWVPDFGLKLVHIYPLLAAEKKSLLCGRFWKPDHNGMISVA